jgi:hypothetical protein
VVRFSSVGIAIRYGLEGSGFELGRVKRILSSSHPLKMEPTQALVEWVLGREFYNSPPYIAELENG